MISKAPSSSVVDNNALLARLAAREQRIELLEEENRWLKAQLFARSSEKTPIEERVPDQARLFNEAEALARAAEQAPVSVTIPAHERGKGGRKKLSAALPRVEVVHDLSEDSEALCRRRHGAQAHRRRDFRAVGFQARTGASDS